VSIKKTRLAVMSLHPSNYQTGIWKQISKLDSIDLTVYYFSDIGLKKVYDSEFNITRKWDDINLLEGHKYIFPKNYSKLTVGYGFFSRFNPGIIPMMLNKHDVILLHGYDTISMWLAFIVAWITRVPIIWRGEVVRKNVTSKITFKKVIKKHLLKFLFKRCSKVLYSCSGNKEYLQHYNVPENKLSLIPCAVDNKYFKFYKDKYASRVNNIRKNLGLTVDNFVVIFSGKLIDRKRPKDLITAISKAREQNIVALFVGSGAKSMQVDLNKYIAKTGVVAKFVGYKTQKEISKYYSIADLGVMLSDYDPSPKSLNEMMNFSIPVIVTDAVGTSRDLVKQSKNGYIVKVGDVSAISQHLKYLYREQGVAKKMGERSFKIVQKWNFEADAKAVSAAIRHINNNG